MGKDLLYPLRRIHGLIHDWMLFHKTRCKLFKKYKDLFVQKKKHNPKTVFLVFTPEHSNLGDHAIAYAETELLRKNGVDHVEITGAQLVELQRYKCLNVMNRHPILINGGGNLGTLWFDVEQLMREIVCANPKSQVFILPNTIYYEDTPWGEQEFERSASIYNGHTELYFYAREQISFDKMKGVYRSVELVPDMVLSMNWCEMETVRKGCLLCLRNDRERLCTEQDEKELYHMMRTAFGEEVHYTDMHASYDVPVAERERALEHKRKEFQSAELVVTDRLHGMILCAITGTPCVVIDSRSPKLRGCYEWIRHLEYIRFCNDIADVLPAFQSIPTKIHAYENTYMLPYYDNLIGDILARI